MSGGGPGPAAGGPGASASFGANLARRVATAALVLPPLLAGLLLGPPLVGVAVVAAALALGLVETFRLLEARRLVPFRAAGWLLSAALFYDVAYPRHAGPPLWPAATAVLLAAVLRRAADLERAVPAAAGTLLGALYLGGVGGTMAALRVADPGSGAWRLVLMLAIVMGSDTFAFFAGRLAGRRRLAPSVSPGKTVEGALGGVAGGVIGALAARAAGLPDLPASHAAALGAVAAGAGILGDLFESALKRWAGVKDSGALFPGHGGMLDRLDSLLFGAPVLYYYFLYPR